MKNKLIKHRIFILRRIILAKIYRLLGPLNVKLQPGRLFCIKPGYHSADVTERFDDRPYTDEWQFDVYKSAAALFKNINGKTVIDVGCGSAYKLLNLFGNFDTVGIELPDMCHWLSSNYPSKKWISFEDADPNQLQSDMVICSDVVEHIKNPDDLMDFLKMIDLKYLVLSTPERNSVRGKRDFGPPENTSHYREWNAGEFKEYVSNWFIVQEQIISSDRSISQVLYCTKKEEKSTKNGQVEPGIITGFL